MSSTTEDGAAGWPARLVRAAGTAVLVLSGVVVLFALVFAATGQATAAFVWPAPPGGPSALPESVSVLYWGPGFAIVTSDRRDYVRRLYGHGAYLVLPVRQGGCLALRPD